jgi:hypothetical protein
VPDGRKSGVGLEHLGDLGDALSSVCAIAMLVEATELVAVQTTTRDTPLNVRGY